MPILHVDISALVVPVVLCGTGPWKTPTSLPCVRAARAWGGFQPSRIRRAGVRTHVIILQKRSTETDANNVDDGSQRNAETAQGLPSEPSLFGAMALITGSTVGAGMLALPAVTAPAGFVPTAAALTATWALLAVEALLLAEVNLALMAQNGTTKNSEVGNGNGDSTKLITLRQMAERTLGKPGKLVTAVYLLLSYCLLVAYLAKAAEVLDFFTGHVFPPAVAAAAVVVATASLFLLGGTSAADRLNQCLTSTLLALFTVIIGVGALQTDVPSTVAQGPQLWEALHSAVPIMFLSLVFHDLVPFICSYLRGDRATVSSAILYGSLVPLAMFLSWEAVALGLMPISEILPEGSPAAIAVVYTGDGSVQREAVLQLTNEVSKAAAEAMVLDPLQIFVQRSGPVIGTAVQTFSFLAVLTSFLGTVMGLRETLQAEVPPLVRQAGRLLRIEAMVSFEREPAPLDANACVASDEEEAAAPVSDPFKRFLSDPGKTMALALALGPPLAFTAENPDAFMGVLSLAGGYGMTVLYGIMPPLMAWNLRTKGLNSKITVESQVQPVSEAVGNLVMVPGGGAVLAVVLTAAMGVGLTRLVTDLDASHIIGGSSTVTPNTAVVETAVRIGAVAGRAMAGGGDL